MQIHNTFLRLTKTTNIMKNPPKLKPNSNNYHIETLNYVLCLGSVVEIDGIQG